MVSIIIFGMHIASSLFINKGYKAQNQVMAASKGNNLGFKFERRHLISHTQNVIRYTSAIQRIIPTQLWCHSILSNINVPEGL